MTPVSIRIFLVGLPGSGKTHLASALSRELGLDWLDLDHEIVRFAGTSIPEIFQTQGEAGFRELESARLHALLSAPGSWILATGGGTPCFHDNMDAMNAAGLTVFLATDTEIIIRRLKGVDGKGKGSGRPLLEGGQSVEDRILELERNRMPFYQKAKIRIADGLSGQEAAAQIRAALKAEY